VIVIGLLIVCSFHKLVDDVIRITPALCRQVAVDHGAGDLAVPHVPLYDRQRDACFQQVRGIAVAQGVDADPFFIDPCPFDCSA
jgi:hypothetical protein